MGTTGLNESPLVQSLQRERQDSMVKSIGSGDEGETLNLTLIQSKLSSVLLLCASHLLR